MYKHSWAREVLFFSQPSVPLRQLPLTAPLTPEHGSGLWSKLYESSVGSSPPAPQLLPSAQPALRNHGNAHTPVIKQGIISALSLLSLCYPSNIVNGGGGRTVIGTYRKSITCKWKCKKAGVWVVCNGSSTLWALLPFRSKRRREWRCRQSVDLNAVCKLCGYFCRYCQFLKDTFIFSNVAS